MFNKKNVLLHHQIDDSYPDIVPIKTAFPEWYKKTEKFNGEKKLTRLPLPHNFKSCSPFNDSFCVGYMIPLPVDIGVEKSEGGPVITWNDASVKFLELRDSKTNEALPTPTGFSSNHYAWQTKYMIKIPKGYSALLTHPLNRFDLPFLTLSGIVDGEFILHPGNVPVFFKEDFEGIIPAGTPIAQLILFKTEDWLSKKDKSILADGEIGNKQSINSARGWYKKNYWKKKRYE